MIYDTHIHTNFSHDSRMDIADVITKAEQNNLGIIITEHMDLNYPDPLAFHLDVPAYLKAYEQYRSEKLLLGIELGMDMNALKENRQLIETYPFDFVLGSIHVVDDMDIYEAEFYTGKTKKQIYERYFEVMAECVNNFTFIDSLGHIDYIARYARFNDREIHYADFTEHINHILDLLAKQHVCMEINTRRMGETNTLKNLLPIYQRYYELGGRYVTIGSDAHTFAEIGKHFTLALEIAERSGLKPVWFKERQMQYPKNR